jgi:hypothetical protein
MIILEVVVARKVIILCGERSIPWNSLCKVIRAIVDGLSKTPSAVKRAARINTLRTNYQHSAQGLPVWEAVKIGRRQKCRDPADSIWTVIGLSLDLAQSIPNIRRARSPAELRGYVLRACLGPSGYGSGF